MKIRLFLFIILLVLPMAGSADFEQNNYSPTYANIMTTTDLEQGGVNDNCDVTFETSLDREQRDNQKD